MKDRLITLGLLALPILAAIAGVATTGRGRYE
jgi:hypothetical protein